MSKIGGRDIARALLIGSDDHVTGVDWVARAPVHAYSIDRFTSILDYRHSQPYKGRTATMSSTRRSSSGVVKSNTSSQNGQPVSNAIPQLWSSYLKSTPIRHKIIDAFLVFNMITGILIFAHGILLTTFPFDSWIASFASTAGQFVLTASLRIQTTRANREDFPKVSEERAFIDFLFGSVILHFFVLNYLQ
ncbi:unnamed protein product [Sympodiomycopsis kandeliae]